jgi:uncharacterized membrane protein YeaQ/YmgE (transglycosylase-associated protein family)
VTNLLIWLFLGSLIGQTANKLFHANECQGATLDRGIGIVGAYLGGLLLWPGYGEGAINNTGFSLLATMAALVGAMLLWGIIELINRGRVVRQPID